MNKPNKMSRWGIGPVFGLISVLYGILIYGITQRNPVFKVGFIPYPFLLTIGLLIIAIGVPGYIISLKSLMQAYNADKLVTTGAYSICRHPIYGAWIFYIVPGIVILSTSWLALTIPVGMYFLLNVLAKKEESYLEKRFGTQYTIYKKNTPFVVPIGLAKIKRISTQST